MIKIMKSHFLAAFTTFKNWKKCLVPGKNAYLVNLVPEKVNLVLASKIIWQQCITAASALLSELDVTSLFLNK